MIADDRAMRIAVAAGEQVAKNPELAAAQRKAWARFIRIVWSGGPAVQPPEPTSRYGQSSLEGISGCQGGGIVSSRDSGMHESDRL
jgi:hypothetical protein